MDRRGSAQDRWASDHSLCFSLANEKSYPKLILGPRRRRTAYSHRTSPSPLTQSSYTLSHCCARKFYVPPSQSLNALNSFTWLGFSRFYLPFSLLPSWGSCSLFSMDLSSLAWAPTSSSSLPALDERLPCCDKRQWKALIFLSWITSVLV